MQGLHSTLVALIQRGRGQEHGHGPQHGQLLDEQVTEPTAVFVGCRQPIRSPGRNLPRGRCAFQRSDNGPGQEHLAGRHRMQVIGHQLRTHTSLRAVGAEVRLDIGEEHSFFSRDSVYDLV